MTVPSGADRRLRFEALAGRVYEPLQRYARRRTDPDTADDVVADALLVAWRRLDDVPPDAELAWCYGVARRCLANQRRGRDRHLRLVDRIAAQPGPREPADGPLDAELGAALATLGDDDRELLRLWAWERLEPRELAVVLDVSANAVSLRLQRARRRLADALEGVAPGPVAAARHDPPPAGHASGGRTEEDPS